MTETLAASLEARGRPFCGSRDETGFGCSVDERRGCIEHLAHVLGVWLPVRREAQRAAGRERFRQQFDECRLNQPTLVMPLLRPRIGKKMCTSAMEAGGSCCCSTSTAS